MAAPPSKTPSLQGNELAKQNIREQVYALLRERMHRGEIGYESRLVDHEIAADLDVSRMPVREALLQLKNEGYVEGTSRGFVLRRFSPEDIASIFEVRLLLEPAAAASACKKATLEGLGKMKTAVAAAERAQRQGDVQGYMQANWAFRSAWVEMVPNKHLVQIIDRLREHAQAVRLATLEDKAYRALSLKHTKAILEAFVAQDEVAVAERLALNLRESAASYYATLAQLMEQEAAAQAETAPRTVRRRRSA
jgi:DNA-binding GntR family transcriptional regulator